MAPHMSYTGSCTVDGTSVFCSDMNFSVDSKPTFYEHTLGLIESHTGIQGGAASLGGIQRKYYRYSPVAMKASISGPISESFLAKLFTCAHSGGTIPALGAEGENVGTNGIDVSLVMWDNGVKKILKSAYLQSLTIDFKAGDVASFSAEFVGKSVAYNGAASTTPADCDKLLTWDRCGISVNASFNIDSVGNVTGGEGNSVGAFTNVSAFSLSFNNPIIPIYTSSGLLPFDLRIGMQQISGSISIYGTNSYFQGAGTISVTAGSISHGFTVAFEPPADKAGASSLFISTTKFTAYSDSGSAWS